MNPGPHARLEVTLINLMGTHESFIVEPLAMNQFCCVRSPDFMTDFRILHGDIFEAADLGAGQYKLIGMIKTGVMRHFRVDLGLYLLPIVAKDQRAANVKAFDVLGEHFDDVIITDSLKEFLDGCDGSWEVNEFFQFYCMTLHLPDSHVAELFARLSRFCPGIASEKLIEIFAGECDD